MLDLETGNDLIHNIYRQNYYQFYELKYAINVQFS